MYKALKKSILALMIADAHFNAQPFARIVNRSFIIYIFFETLSRQRCVYIYRYTRATSNCHACDTATTTLYDCVKSSRALYIDAISEKLVPATAEAHD